MVRAKAPDVCAHYLIIKKQAIFVVHGKVARCGASMARCGAFRIDAKQDEDIQIVVHKIVL